MSKRWDNAREEGIATLTVEELRARLLAAEEVCVTFGWCAVRREGPREVMAFDAWQRWYTLVGTENGGPDLMDFLAALRGIEAGS